jgi:hypothetical protein
MFCISVAYCVLFTVAAHYVLSAVSCALHAVRCRTMFIHHCGCLLQAVLCILSTVYVLCPSSHVLCVALNTNISFSCPGLCRDLNSQLKGNMRQSDFSYLQMLARHKRRTTINVSPEWSLPKRPEARLQKTCHLASRWVKLCAPSNIRAKCQCDK